MKNSYVITWAGKSKPPAAVSQTVASTLVYPSLLQLASNIDVLFYPVSSGMVNILCQRMQHSYMLLDRCLHLGSCSPAIKSPLASSFYRERGIIKRFVKDITFLSAHIRAYES